MDQPYSLEGRVAFVTGASRGIGRSIALALAKAGAAVACAARALDQVQSAAAEIESAGGRACALRLDVTQGAQVLGAVGDAESALGPIDILVNNAGIILEKKTVDVSDEEWDTLFATNLTSMFRCARAVAPGMIARGRGKIINIASVQSELARPGIAPYTATKGAIKNLTRGMCADWAKHGLQINAIAPGYFKTPLNQALVDNPEFSSWLEKRTPAGRWGDVEELVGAAVFLSGKASSFVNGHTLYVDGGITTSL
jgi:gluconate 5-dehydrogenase